MDMHRKYMNKCYALAERAAAEGESPVGSVIVKDGVVIGEAWEKSRQLKDISRHAEMLAILDAVSRGAEMGGATMYSNVEPCILCAYAIRHYRIGEVVYERSAGELGGTNPRFNVLTAEGIGAWGEPPKVTVLSRQ